MRLIGGLAVLAGLAIVLLGLAAYVAHGLAWSDAASVGVLVVLALAAAGGFRYASARRPRSSGRRR